ncbi:T. brucei spp.-specific protein [Trypanosoma brucei gambiense DAL972]|uniref:T. brucei spp.-specific protein n=1 Tax=Trypanosoma brucei gambiense (strain MHOM/CI/86/DAL972) TaxID=679716 RepID=C9ZZW7_TRYB9|nr:T. brucei spp.-specific protein [Trypanosoma brucei gambiense DAL972]CBH16525.1 T. brucei spp.-specific protein [Trypanosoma brucei gambiense DAL972]|eukprot:XP_011778789.1 T. brucei spp.-specific protein [Trypanosoma brucei gambiense DAL972]
MEKDSVDNCHTPHPFVSRVTVRRLLCSLPILPHVLPLCCLSDAPGWLHVTFYLFSVLLKRKGCKSVYSSACITISDNNKNNRLTKPTGSRTGTKSRTTTYLYCGCVPSLGGENDRTKNHNSPQYIQGRKAN